MEEPPIDNGLGRRTELVRKAAAAWSAQIVDLGGRNTLLFYKDLKAGTIDLTPGDDVDRAAVEALLDGRSVRLSSLAARDNLDVLARRARTVRAKATENYEERGLQTMFLAHGMATWTHARSDSTPAAPVLLAPLQLTPRGGAAEDFDLSVADDWDVNPTLIHLLATDFKVHVDAESTLGAEGGGRQALARFAAAARDVPGFQITERVVIGNFSYAKQPLALDIQSSIEAMAAHPVVCAIAGDQSALRELIDRQPIGELSGPEATPPANEFLILDADASQSYVISSTLKGANLVVQGPPGTGKSQTIANLVASLAAHGKSVLFVAEKRAAIEAVVSRLERSGLRDLVLDLHGGTSSRRSTLAELGRALEGFGTVPAVDMGAEHRRLESTKGRLNTYVDALHRTREPYGLSLFEMQSLYLGVPEAVRSTRALARQATERIPWSEIDAVEDELEEWVHLGGPQIGHGLHPWETAVGRVTSPEHAERALELAQVLANSTVPTATRHLTFLLAECGLRRPTTIAEWEQTLAVLQAVETLLQRYRSDLFGLDLDQLAAALAPAGRGTGARLTATLFNANYRAARRTVGATALAPAGAVALLTDVVGAIDVRRRWNERASGQQGPQVPSSFAECTEVFSALTTQLAAIGAYVSERAHEQDLPDVRARMSALIDDRSMLFRLPRLHELETKLTNAGIGSVLEQVRSRRLDAASAGHLLRSSWLRAAIDAVYIADPTIGSFDGLTHATSVDEFREVDQVHIQSGPQRVRRKVAERAVAVLNERVDQAQIVRQQAARKRGHRPLRELVQLAPDVLVAVKPCWAMSPLVVAQLLPSDRHLFDVVVFDEASQIPPAEAIPAILRGRSVIVAGDTKQLPPTAFFSSVSEVESPDDEAMRVTDDMESILDSMAAMLPPPHGAKSLAWHYRSRDERLIAFSNAQPTLYDWSMTTFPGVEADDAIRHVHVEWQPGMIGQEDSVGDEVLRVVELIAEHARTHPDQSLGVITMGIKHADRVSEAVRIRRKTDRSLDEFCGAHGDEPFFVKNLERVQGDERDAIILSVGYGKNDDGRMVYRFGPLLQEGGERRLNVAITRARSSMTVVSSFTADDMEDGRLRSEGAKMLKRYLAYAASRGADFGSVAKSRPAMNPFEQDVYRCLTAAGLSLTPQVGASGYWIDFAAAHPQRPGHYVLAIEADGASYHSAHTTRDRDRLRQEHLERLGWTFHRIWSTEWFTNRDKEVERALAAFDRAVQRDKRGESGRVDQVRATIPVPSAASTAPRRAGRPPTIYYGEPITSYTPDQLDDLIRWIRSDTLLRTDDELLELAMTELGYSRRGSRIVTALEAAIRRTGSRPSPAARASEPSDRSWPAPPTTYRPPGNREAGWKPDPTGRFEHRYWDGSSWTANVARQGTSKLDPL